MSTFDTSTMGVHTNGAALTFYHPHMKDKLVVTTGATAINWDYVLNTQVTPTIGGEVVQILSSTVGPMTIEGITDRDELIRIRDWFLEYMRRAGTIFKGAQFRDETAVVFSYPARGWQFHIQPTALKGFKYDKAVFAIPWAVQAEIVSDNALDFLSGATFSAFTGPLFNPAFQEVGYNDPTGTGPASRFVNPRLSASIPGLANTMGDNFQRLVAQWAGGGYGDFAYNTLIQYAHPSQTIEDEYSALFGSTGTHVSGGGGSGSGSGGGGGDGGQGDPGKYNIVLAINAAWEAQGLPGKVGVADAIVESGLNPNDRATNDGGAGIDGVGLFQVHYGGRSSSAPVYDASIKHRSSKVTDYYSVALQIQEASGWWHDAATNSFPSIDWSKASDSELGSLAAVAEGPKDPVGYAAKVVAALAQAQDLINQANGPTGDRVAVANKLLKHYGVGWIDDNGKGLAQIKKVARGEHLTNAHGEQVDLDARTMKIILWLIDQNYVVGTFAWCEDHFFDSLTGHAGGNAVDISSIDDTAISSPLSQGVTFTAAQLIHGATGDLAPRQEICGGFGNQYDPDIAAFCIPDAATFDYVDDTGRNVLRQEHTNHIHVGY